MGENEPSGRAVSRWTPFTSGLLLEAWNDRRCWKLVHENYAICVLRAGAADWTYRHKHFTVRPGAVYVCEPGELHDTTKAHVAGDFAVFFIEPQLVQAIAEGLGLSGLPHFAPGGVHDVPLWRAFLALPDLLRRAGESLFLEELERLCACLLQHASRSSFMQRRHPLAITAAKSRLTESFRADPRRPMKLQDLATDVGMSYHSLIHGFAKHWCVPPYAYVGLLRAHKAFTDLRHGPSAECSTFGALAAQCGYSDTAHLSRAFRRHWGVPPSALAREIRPEWLRRGPAKA